MLDILRQIQAEMQSIHGKLDDLERGQDAPESGRATPVDPGSSSWTRWADHMEGLKVPMYTKLIFDDHDKEDEKENETTKLFTMSKSTEEFLDRQFSERVDNPTRRQWRHKYGATRLSSMACPKLDKILKPSLSGDTKAKDRQLSKSQALVLDAAGHLAAILESKARGNFNLDSVVDAVHTALKLLGNASCHSAVERRKNLLSDLNPNFKDMAEEDEVFKSLAPQLFGDGLSMKAKERDDELNAL